jgi:hypothetical protein
MSRHHRQKTRQAEAPVAKPKRLPVVLKALVIPIALGAVALVALGFLGGDRRAKVVEKPRPEASVADSAPKERTPAAEPASAAVSLDVLRGKWFREDGGYVLEIKQIEDGGKLEAAYFNPRPIFVAKADASREKGQLKVFVELRDDGYPGCTYNLTYEPESQQLQGVYFQAAMRENYDVVFRRQR